MAIFENYLKTVNKEVRKALERIIKIVRNHVPEAEEGLSYGLPAYKYKRRPLIGFSSNKYGLNIYPFDPRVITAIKNELDGFETSKGVIRYSAEHQLSKKIIILLVDLRIDYLENIS